MVDSTGWVHPLEHPLPVVAVAVAVEVHLGNIHSVLVGTFFVRVSKGGRYAIEGYAMG